MPHLGNTERTLRLKKGECVRTGGLGWRIWEPRISEGFVEDIDSFRSCCGGIEGCVHQGEATSRRGHGQKRPSFSFRPV